MRYAFVVMAAAVLAAGPDLAGDNPQPVLRFFFMDGTVLTGRLGTAHVAVGSPDGTVRKLRAGNIRDLTPGFVSRGELVARVRKLAAQLGARSWHDRKAAHQALARMGPAITRLLETYRNDGDLERRTRIEVLLGTLRSHPVPQPHTPAPPRCPIRQTDRVTLHDTGEIIDRRLVTRRIDIVSAYGNFSVDLADVNAVRRAGAGQADPKSDRPDRITIVLAAGKAVKGEPATPALTLQGPFGRLAVPMGRISRLGFSADRKLVGVILRNGDHLVGGALGPGAIKVKAPGGKTVAVPMASVAGLSVTPGFVPAGLICWNRLDGLPSIVGPEVAFVDIDAFVAGKVANGVQVSPTNGQAMRIPAAIIKEAPRGTIEFWTKTVSPPARKPPTAKKKPRRITSTVWHYEMLHGPLSLTCRSYTVRINPYVYLRCGGHTVRTNPAQKGQEARDLVTVGRWNHVAVVWDVKGIKQFGGAPLGMLVNGRPFGRHFSSPMSGDPMRDYPFPANLVLHRSRATLGPTVVYDELKIWNRVVTDFKP